MRDSDSPRGTARGRSARALNPWAGQGSLVAVQPYPYPTTCAQVAPWEALAARLGDPAHLAALHWDATGGRFADWGNHTEGVRLDWIAWQTPAGALVRRELVRVEDGPPPAPGFVPHFGCAPAASELEPAQLWVDASCICRMFKCARPLCECLHL